MPISEILSDEAVLRLLQCFLARSDGARVWAAPLETRVADSQFSSRNTPYPSFAWVQTVQR